MTSTASAAEKPLTNQSLATALQRRIDAHGIDLAEFARRTGMPEGHLGELLGETPLDMSTGELAILCHMLDTKPSAVMLGAVGAR